MEGTWYMDAVCRLTDRMVTRGGRRRAGLRDAALLILRASGVTRRELYLLRGVDLQQDDGGRIYVWVTSPAGHRRLHRVRVGGATDEWVHKILFPYLEAERLWGSDRPLFAGRGGRPLAPRSSRMIEHKHRGSRG